MTARPGLRHRLLATDLDGTLVDRRQRIVARSAAALDRYRAAGGTVVIATGRNEDSAGVYHRALGLDTPMILCNGARIHDPATRTDLLDLSLGDAWPRLAEDVLPHLADGIGAVSFHGRAAHVARPGPGLGGYADRDGIVLQPRTRPGSLAAPAKVMLILATRDAAAAADARERVAAECPELRVVQSEDTYLEILPGGAGKESALARLAEHLGIGIDATAAVGDNPNDAAMLRAAGLGAAVGDGHPEARAAADVVVAPCADGGIADLVDLLLRRESQAASFGSRPRPRR